MARIRFAANSLGSQGLKAIRQELQNRGHDALIIKHKHSKYIPRDTDLIINWGIPLTIFPSALNNNAANASNKLRAFELMVNNKLRWTTSKEVAKTFKLCYCRTLLHSSQGRGIVVATSPDQVVDAPLYTKGIKSVRAEYRVHVFKGEVIDFAQKKKLSEEELTARGVTVNPLIRNYENGYIYARENVVLDEGARDASICAVNDLSLDFAAVDVVVSGYSGKSFVLEANSAPGVAGTTVIKYADAIENLL